jgi:hypothetical protein
MKRVLLTAAMVAIGAALFCAFRSSAARFKAEMSSNRDALVAERASLAQAQKKHTELTRRIHELKREFAARPDKRSSEMAWANLIETNDLRHLPPDVRERLLAELGFNWNTSGNYVVVSKESLRNLGVPAVDADRLTDAVCSVLAVTPEERAGIESLMTRLAGELKDWVIVHAQRLEPQGDVLAKYSLPADSEFSQSLSNRFAGAVIGALGSERGELMLDYASSWMLDMRMRGDRPTTLTVRRPQAGADYLPFELERDGGGMGSAVTPANELPYIFRSIFPGGWADLTQREGFELPKQFKK